MMWLKLYKYFRRCRYTCKYLLDGIHETFISADIISLTIVQFTIICYTGQYISEYIVRVFVSISSSIVSSLFGKSIGAVLQENLSFRFPTRSDKN